MVVFIAFLRCWCVTLLVYLFGFTALYSLTTEEGSRVAAEMFGQQTEWLVLDYLSACQYLYSQSKFYL